MYHTAITPDFHKKNFSTQPDSATWQVLKNNFMHDHLQKLVAYLL